MLAKVAEGALLVGTDQGLARWVATDLTLEEETAGYAIRAIGLGPADSVWLGTQENGLLYFDGNRWTAPPQNIVPPAQSIHTIAVDAQNTVWIAAAQGGLLRYVP